MARGRMTGAYWLVLLTVGRESSAARSTRAGVVFDRLEWVVADYVALAEFIGVLTRPRS